MVKEGDLTLGGEHTIQYADDVLKNCIPEISIVLLTNVTQTNSIKIKMYHCRRKTIKILKTV